eukprot:CAMPEP_0119123324 /NCGR_PEP_ID=MMETSP1310-20130426/3304_1 /TAXON_ID=464262 /ORGANISM="Genus nov. species nov., Strain RCC2339" /LENGTH=209 /DNA_ID=CAMNT_0007113115 /DNA_START=331 /DNA_END=957 /DNA_ORIENTATION=+
MESIAEQPLGVQDHESTLHESVGDTMKRDLRMIGLKLFHVLCPHGKGPTALRDWDLWGPLLFCSTLSLILTSAVGTSGSQGAVFSLVFLVIFVGSVGVTLNAKLVGAKASFFQCLCVLGYCVFPLVIAALVIWILPKDTPGLYVITIALSAAGLFWATWATVPFFGSMVDSSRKPLVVYPVFLFYIFLAILVMGAAPSPDATNPTIPTP